MKKNVQITIYSVLFVAATLFMTMCGGTGTPQKPGDGLVTTTENLPDGTVFTVTAPRSVTCSVVSDTSGYPPGFRGYIIDVSGTLNPGEKATLSFKGTAAFDDTDQIAYYSGSAWVSVATTLSADKLTISATVDHLSDWAVCFDIWPPWVVEESVSPSDGAGSVPITSPVVIEFSEKMNESSAQNAFSLVDQLAVEVQGSFSWSSGGTVMTFTPDEDLGEITTYSITVTVDAQDFTGNNMESEFSSEFTTGFKDDTIAPQVVSVSPGDGEEDVFVETDITVTFSEQMNQASAEAALLLDGVTPTGSFSWVGNTMTFDPDTNLDNDTEYQIEVTTDAQDVAGNPLATAYSWTFTTISATTNTVAGTLTYPGSNGEGKYYFVVIDDDMDIDTSIDVYFDTWGSGSTATYEFTDVPAGTYYIYAVLDITGELWPPSQGDYTGSYGNIGPVDPPNAVVPSSGTVLFNFDLYETGNTVSGTLYYTGGGTPDGKTYIAAIVDDFQTETPVAMYTDTWPSGTSEAPYQFKNVDAGTYIIYAVLYDEFTEFDIPDAGDYVGSYGNLDFWTGTPNVTIEDIGTYTDLDFDLYEWSTLVGIIKGTVSEVPSGSDGAYYWVGLLDENFNAVADDVSDEGYIEGSITSFEYSLNPVPPGNYYIVAFVDMDGDEDLSNGDYIGYYGSLSVDPPDTQNVVIPGSGMYEPYDITLYEYIIPTITISGTISFPADLDPGTLVIVILSPEDFNAGTVSDDIFAAYSGQDTFDYNFTVEEGEYYITAFIDYNGNFNFDRCLEPGGGYPLINYEPGFMLYQNDTSGVDFDVFEPKVLQYYTAGTSNIYMLAIDENGGKWFATFGAGLHYLDDNGTPLDSGDDQWSYFTTATSEIASDIVYCVSVDENGGKWIGTSSGLCYFDDNGTPLDNSDNLDTWLTFTTADGLPSDYISVIAIDENGGKWLCSGIGEGFLYYDEGDDSTVKTPDDVWVSFTSATPNTLPSDSISDIVIDEYGGKWVTTSQGACYFDDLGTPADKTGDEWTTYTTSDGLVANSVWAVAIDSEGDRWFAHINDGISYLDDFNTPADKADDNWTTYVYLPGDENSPLNNQVQAVTADGMGGKWFGHSMGASYLDSLNSTWLRFDEEFSYLSVHHIAIDEGSGGIWFCLGGQDMFDPGVIYLGYDFQ